MAFLATGERLRTTKCVSSMKLHGFFDYGFGMDFYNDKRVCCETRSMVLFARNRVNNIKLYLLNVQL